MPLHLLGKKSWNVYNSTNIDRVKRDEAEARAKEEAEEQRMQEEDAQRRIASLRGELLTVDHDAEDVKDNSKRVHRQHDRKRKKLRNEDETDCEIRYARLDAEAGSRARQVLLQETERTAPLHDQAGNIQLFPIPDENALRKREKNFETELEKAQKRNREEGQYSLRFSDAVGAAKGTDVPWYNSSNSSSKRTHNTAAVLEDSQGKDVWGNEDPLRKARERNRISTNDPLMMMKQAQSQLKQSEKDRDAWRRQQRAILDKSRSEHRHSQRKRRHEDGESLDDFTLDAPASCRSNGDGRSKDGHRHRKRHRESESERRKSRADR